MSGFLRSRRAVGVLLAVLVVHIVLGVATFGPSTSLSLTDVPVGLVDEDGGELGSVFVAAELEVLAWQEVESRTALHEGLDDRAFAAGLIIPAGAGDTLAALAAGGTEPVTLELRTNPGRNAESAQAAAQAITGLVAAAADEQRSALLEAASAADTDVAPAAVAALAAPLTLETTAVHAPAGPAQAATPLVLVAMLWIGSLVAMLITFLSLHRDDSTPGRFLSAQLLIMAALAVLQPLSIIAVGNLLLGLDLALTWPLWATLALTTAMFFLLQSAVLNWFGFGGWPILVLLWLFSFTLLAVPIEGLAAGYRILVASWLPARFPYEALQGLLFFDGAGHTARALAITAGLTVGGLTALLASWLRLARSDLRVHPLARRLARTADTDAG